MGPESPGPGSRFGLVLAAMSTLGVFAGPRWAIGAFLGLIAWRVQRDRTSRRKARQAVAAAVPDLVDLFALAAAAGLPVASALEAVAPRAPPAVRPAVVAAARQRQHGASTEQALLDLGVVLGAAGANLTEALIDAAATGAPLVPALRTVAAAAHDQRRRTGEEAARRLPVALLFPLACCILPAAVVLALVPVLLVSLESLHP